MRILLINPKSINKDALPIPPLGVLYLAAWIRKNGYENIEIIDNNLDRYSEKKLKHKIEKCDVVGVTGTTSQFQEAKIISQIAEQNNAISIFGGPHASAVPGDVLLNTSFDFVIIGEGENTFLELLNAIKKDTINFDIIDGIAYKWSNGIITTKPRKLIKNLDSVPFPARDLIPIEKYGNKELKRFGGAYTHMMSSRGCTSKCTFCASPEMWKYCRIASAKKIFQEIMHLYERYRIKNIHFQDDNFTLSKKRVIELCDLIINSKIDFKWSCQTRPDRVDFEILKKMKQAGCVQIEYGVESGDPKILKTSKKGYTKEQIKQAFWLAKKIGITTYGFFLIGLPGETIWSWIRSMIFAKRLHLNSCVWTILVPFPGTEIYSKRMVKILNPDYSKWLYKEPVIKSGKFGPKSLKIMRWIADKFINGLRNTGTYKKMP